MRRFGARIVLSLLTFIVGVSLSRLWHDTPWRHAPRRASATHDIENEPPKFLRHANGIPGQYIVVLRDDIPDESVEAIAAELTRTHAGEVRFIYRAVLKGFSTVSMPEEAAKAISRDPRVSYVESDVWGRLD